jgi:hypothetical protein
MCTAYLRRICVKVCPRKSEQIMKAFSTLAHVLVTSSSLCRAHVRAHRMMWRQSSEGILVN